MPCQQNMAADLSIMNVKVIRTEPLLHLSLHFSKPDSNYRYKSFSGLIPDLVQSPERPKIHCLLHKLKALFS